MSLQLKGNLKLGPEDQSTPTVTDYSGAITSIVINRERSSVTIPPTLKDARETEKAGPLRESVTINFFSDVDAASIWAELYDAMDTDSAILYFEGNLNEGATGADNPQFSGYFSVLGLETGADVGTLREQSQTYPVYVGDVAGPATTTGVTKATS